MSDHLVGILFDLDGTLCNSEELAFQATNMVLSDHGIQKRIALQEYREGSIYPTKQRLAWHATSNVDDPIGDELCNAFDKYYINLISESNPPFYDGIISLLYRIKEKAEVRTAVLSNASVDYVKRVIEVQGLQHVFSTQLGIGENLICGKPCPDGLQSICASEGLSPARCVYIGDSPTDSQAALAAGMHSIGVSWGNFSRSALSGTC